jgi:phage replication O-like protein O
MATPTQFQGFQFPTTTPVPDEVFDVLLPKLTDAELRVLLYIIRRTYGFKKQSDNISLSQMVGGITKKDGAPLDHGVGLSKATVARAVKGLQKQRIILAKRNSSPERGNEPTTYSLRFQTDTPTPCPTQETRGVLPVRQALSQPQDTQQTVGQETVRQEYDDDVCQALANFGISQKMAVRLAKEHPKAQILSKLQHVTALVEAKSPLVSKNPQGFLVKALEDGYLSQPPRGYKAASEDEEAEEKQTLAVEHCQRAGDEATEPVLEQHSSQPSEHTDLTTQSAWSKVLASLKEQVPATTFATWLKDTMLLGLTDRAAKILVPSSLAVTWLEKRLYWGIVRALREVVHQDVEVHFVTAT